MTKGKKSKAVNKKTTGVNVKKVNTQKSVSKTVRNASAKQNSKSENSSQNVKNTTATKPVKDAPMQMRLAKIKNRYIFKSGNADETHTYVVYTDKRTNEVRAVPTTHIYIIDPDKEDKLRKGLLCKVKFDCYETPSGVNNYYHNKDSEGKQLVVNHKDISYLKTKIKKEQADKIYTFAKFARKEN